MEIFFDSLTVFLKLIQPYQTGIATISAAFIAWAYNHNKNKLDKESFKRDLFLPYNERYDNLNHKLDKLVFKEYEIHRDHQIGEGQSLTEIWNMLFEDEPQETPKFRNTINDYLNLCAEEYYWYKKGLIDKKVWKCWYQGMKYWYSNSDFIRLSVEQEIDLKTSYYNKDFLSLFTKEDLNQKLLAYIKSKRFQIFRKDMRCE